jgi:hypothetical protein
VKIIEVFGGEAREFRRFFSRWSEGDFAAQPRESPEEIDGRDLSA